MNTLTLNQPILVLPVFFFYGHVLRPRPAVARTVQLERGGARSASGLVRWDGRPGVGLTFPRVQAADGEDGELSIVIIYRESIIYNIIYI